MGDQQNNPHAARRVNRAPNGPRLRESWSQPARGVTGRARQLSWEVVAGVSEVSLARVHGLGVVDEPAVGKKVSDAEYPAGTPERHKTLARRPTTVVSRSSDTVTQDGAETAVDENKPEAVNENKSEAETREDEPEAVNENKSEAETREDEPETEGDDGFLSDYVVYVVGGSIMLSVAWLALPLLGLGAIYAGNRLREDEGKKVSAGVLILGGAAPVALWLAVRLQGL